MISMLLTGAAFSLVSMIVVFLFTLLALTLFLKPKPSILRLAIAFVVSWGAVAAYLPFKGISYYTQNSGGMYIAEAIIAIIALFAVTKLFPNSSTLKPITMNTNNPPEAEDSFVRGFHGIPDDSRLSAMSFAELASLLTECEKDSAKVSVVEREMKKRIAKDQASFNRSNILIATLIAGVFTIVGAVIGSVVRQHSPVSAATMQEAQGVSSKSPAATADQAIRRVDKCVCFRSAEGQKLQPWELDWNDAEKLRQQFSHCVCEAHIDLKVVPEPKRYVTPGTVVQ